MHTDFATQQANPNIALSILSKHQADNQNLMTARDADNIDASYGGQSAISKLSKKDVEMSYIMQAISNLDDSQRQDLVSILKEK